MMRLRHIVQSALCCLLCLTVCAVPALAGNEQYTDGFLYWSNDGSVDLFDGVTRINILNGYFPASFSADDGETINDNYRNFEIRGKPIGVHTGADVLWSCPDMYVEVLFSVPAPLTVTVGGVTSANQGSVMGYLQLVGVDSSGSYNYTGDTLYASRIDCIYDSDYVSTTGSSPSFKVTSGTYEVKRYFGYRFYFDTFQETKSIRLPKWLLVLSSNFNGKYVFSDPNYIQGISDKVTVNTGILQEINGKLADIQLNTAYLMGDVFEIKNDLRDSNSSIWGAFKDSVSGLFVPSSADLEGVKNGFDQLAQDKLGGAYQSVDLVKDGVSQVRDKINNPTADYSVEFPGIEVPLGEPYGTVRLIGRQDVIIPSKLRDVLYPIAGIIIPIVCTTWTVRLGIDMVNCFMSGMSYAQFLHRFTDSEDDEA